MYLDKLVYIKEDNMENKLLEYGFSDEQVKILIKKGKIQTTHGTYVLKGNKLELNKSDGTVKEVWV